MASILPGIPTRLRPRRPRARRFLATAAAALVTLAFGALGSATGQAATPPVPPRARVAILSPKAGDVLPPTGFDIQVQVVVPAADAALVPVTPGLVLPTSPFFKPGPSHDFPGLVVLDSGTASTLGGPRRNLAGLFQVIGLEHTAGGALVVDADWLALKPLFGAVAHPRLTAFVVSGTAPALVPLVPTNADVGRTAYGHTLLSNVASVVVSTVPPKAPATVSVATTKLGPTLVDARGFTLYEFAKDAPGVSRCTGACAALWPPVPVGTARPSGGAGVTGTLGVLVRSDGTRQLTCDGWPLYTYRGDAAPGQVNGEGFKGLWFAAAPDCSPIHPASPSSSPSSSYSY